MRELSEISISTLHGVGRVKAQAYASVGVHTLLDLLYYFPRAYEDRASIVPLSATENDRKYATVLTVATEPKIANIRRGMSLLKFRAFDESGVCDITYFNQNYLKDKFPIGSTFRFFGKVEKKKTKYEMTSPAAEPWVEFAPPPPFFPIYRLTEGLSQKQIAQNIEEILPLASAVLPDPLPDSVRIEHKLCTIHYALKQIHKPESYQALATAKRRLIFDEFFLFATGLRAQGKKAVRLTAPRVAEAFPVRAYGRAKAYGFRHSGRYGKARADEQNSHRRRRLRQDRLRHGCYIYRGQKRLPGGTHGAYRNTRDTAL